MAPKHLDYVLGHNDREQLRLIRQARILAPFTDSFLRAAGIVSGMRVLDIGCGMGDVTMLAAQLVGPTGSVVSVDQDTASIETARRRVSAIGLENVKFHRADLLTFADDELFDAIISRLVLEFVPDTTAASHFTAAGWDHGISRAVVENLARLHGSPATSKHGPHVSP